MSFGDRRLRRRVASAAFCISSCWRESTSPNVPTIGIGTGPWCEGQVLVYQNMPGEPRDGRPGGPPDAVADPYG